MGPISLRGLTKATIKKYFRLVLHIDSFVTMAHGFGEKSTVLYIQIVREKYPNKVSVPFEMMGKVVYLIEEQKTDQLLIKGFSKFEDKFFSIIKTIKALTQIIYYKTNKS